MRTYNICLYLGLFALMATFAPSALAQQETNWETFMQVDYEEVENEEGRREWVPKFAPSIIDLDQQSIRISGYMIPLGFEEEQTHFLISAWPGDGCYFHLPGGADSVIEIESTEGVEFTFDTIEMEGKLELLRSDPYGLLYRMVDAKPIR